MVPSDLELFIGSNNIDPKCFRCNMPRTKPRKLDQNQIFIEKWGKFSDSFQGQVLDKVQVYQVNQETVETKLASLNDFHNL